ncbi:MAG: TatD family hydrolase [Treponema sp.]|jgi:TatD DNase family protein|nr:TatD family hydrolase [Treponema sp.]
MSEAFMDTHAHLSMLPPGKRPPEERIAQLFAGGFGGIIDVGTQAEDLRCRLKTFARFDRIWFSAGIWPAPEAIAERERLIPLLEQQITAAPPDRLIAVGECGLDRHHNRQEAAGVVAGERELLELHLDMAKRHSLPIIIHSREAAQETAELLSRYPEVRGVIHCFSYGIPEARRFLDLGYYLSFAGSLTYKNAGNLREALPFVPLERLLLETDAPYLAPQPFRGKPSEPGMVAETYRRAAALRGIPLEALQAAVARNGHALFFSKSGV